MALLTFEARLARRWLITGIVLMVVGTILVSRPLLTAKAHCLKAATLGYSRMVGASQQVCRQCGSSLGVRRGRCQSCGALINVAVVARDERLRDLLRFDIWDWLGELAGLVLLTLVLANVAPVWALAIAAVLTLRPFVRFAIRVAGRVLLEE